MYVLKTHSKFEKSMSSFGNSIEKNDECKCLQLLYRRKI